MKSKYSGAVIIIGLLFFAIVALFSALCWSYSISTWAYILHKEVHVQMWQCVALGFVPVLGQASFMLAAITWIVTLFI